MIDEAAQHSIDDALKAGHKVLAVKRYREATGASLSASREAIEERADEIGLPTLQAWRWTSGDLLSSVLAVAAAGVLALAYYALTHRHH